MGIENKELLEEAGKLEINVDDFESEDDLKEAIETKKEEIQKEKENDINYWKERAKYLEQESKKAFEARDITKKERRKLQEKIKEFEKQLSNSPSKEEFEKIQSRLKETEEQLSEYRAKEEEEELKKKTEVERVKINFEKQLENFRKEMEAKLAEKDKVVEEFNKKLKEKDTNIARLQQARLRAELIEAATKFEAYNPTQIYYLLKEKFQYDDNLDKFVNLITDPKTGKLTGELDVIETVEEFLKDPTNANLVKSSANKGGTGHKETQKPSGGKKPKGKGYNPNDPELIAQAEERGLEVEDYIEILQLRDEKMKRIREQKD